MKLIIAEKPAIGRTLAAVLGASEKRNGYLEGNGWIVSQWRKPESYSESGSNRFG